MKRWFGVLVLGGAALSACTEGDDAEGDAGGEGAKGPAGTGGSGAGAEGGAGSGTAAGGSGGHGGSQGGSSEGGSLGGSSEGGSPGAGGAAMECPEAPEPTAACGCPCCWVSNCLNDEPCCETFCASGNDGAGCCGV